MTPAAAPFARTPEPPYYAVVFTSQRTEEDRGYGAMSDAMARLALEQPGCLGAESARDADGFGITVSYWRAEADILAWKARAAHLVAQRAGKARWYDDYVVRVARVERAYDLASSRLDEALPVESIL